MEPVIHNVRLVDLNSLAELWEMPSSTLGLDINRKGELVPELIGSDDDKASVAELNAFAAKAYPYSDKLNIVIQVRKIGRINEIAVATLDEIDIPVAQDGHIRWWTFTDTYVEKMH